MDKITEFIGPVGFPTIDRPFGIHLWPLFDKLWYSVLGYHAEDFKYVPGELPLSTLKQSVAVIFAYYVIIFGGRELMRNVPAFKLKTLFIIHNFYLTVISFVLLVLFIEELLPIVYNHGIFYAICDHNGGWTKRLVVLYYLNYITKYIEFIDTVFLFLKKKPLTFLHCYHHGATAFLCYTQLVGSTSVSWVVISINLLVHVVMYWYYFQSARGIRIWWKEWITRLQILQFLIDVGFIYFASYTYFTSTYFPWMPNSGTCAGEEYAAFAGLICITSYLVLFISFYFATYKKDKKEKKPVRRAVRSMSQAEVPDIKALTNGMAHLPNGNGHAMTTATSPKGPVTRSRKA